jgi:hypothetical protein
MEDVMIKPRRTADRPLLSFLKTLRVNSRCFGILNRLLKQY